MITLTELKDRTHQAQVNNNVVKINVESTKSSNTVKYGRVIKSTKSNAVSIKPLKHHVLNIRPQSLASLKYVGDVAQITLHPKLKNLVKEGDIILTSSPDSGTMVLDVTKVVVGLDLTLKLLDVVSF